MKKGIILLLFSFLLFSCSSDDKENQEGNDLIGYWTISYKIEKYYNPKTKNSYEKKVVITDKSPILVFHNNGKGYETKLDNAGFEIESSIINFIWWSENNKYHFEHKSYTSINVENNYIIAQYPFIGIDPSQDTDQLLNETFYYIKTSNNYKPKE